MTDENLPALFDEIEEFIGKYQEKLNGNEELDMEGLDQKIEQLCSHVMQLSREEQVQHVERLTSLLEGLNTLGLTLRDQMEDAGSPTKHREANVAYKTADSRDNFGKRDGDGDS